METHYNDVLADKRTIAQKYGNQELMKNKLKPNPKYKNIGNVIDTGKTIKNTTSVSDKLVSKRISELFKRIKHSTLVKLLHSSENEGENIYNLGNENNDNKSTKSNKSNLTNYSELSNRTNMLGDLNEIDFIILDLREENDYNHVHIINALSYPGVLIPRDKFLPEMYSMKNKERKMIILYHFDERNGIPYANLLFEKGYDNVFLLSGGIEEFQNNYPQYLEGSDKEKYINLKIERDEKQRIIEEKRIGGKSKFDIKNKSNIGGKSNVNLKNK